jgi:hypothetical protein
LCPRTFALFTLRTSLNAIICYSQLNTQGVLGHCYTIPREWIFSHRCSWMAVYVFCRNAQNKPHSDPRDVCTLSLLYQLPNCNLFTQHALFILWRDTTSELWTPVQFPLNCYTVLLYSHCLLYLHYYYPFTTRYAQSFVYSKPVRLTTSS